MKINNIFSLMMVGIFSLNIDLQSMTKDEGSGGGTAVKLTDIKTSAASGETLDQDQIDKILQNLLMMHNHLGDLASLKQRISGLEKVPAEVVANSRLCDIDEDERCCKPDTLSKKLCCALNNIVYCDCPRKYRNTTVLQHLFQFWLIRGSIQHGHFMLETLLQYPFNLNELFYASIFGRLRITVLHATVMLDDSKLVEMVLAKKPLVDAQDSQGLTSLQRLIMRNNALLASAKDKPLNVEQRRLNEEHLQIAKLLVEAGAARDVNFVMGWFCRKKRIRANDYMVNKGLFDRARKAQ